MSRRPNVEAREKILRTAYGLFAKEGYEAVSMERVAAECGMKKATVFYYYPTKCDLGRAVVEAAAKRHAEGVRALFADAEREPAAAVRSLFDYGAAGRRRCARACFIGKMGQELGEGDEELMRPIAECMEEWREQIAGYFSAWHRRGYFRSGFRAAELADGVLALYEGGVLIAKVVDREEPVEAARRTAVRVVLSWKV